MGCEYIRDRNEVTQNQFNNRSQIVGGNVGYDYHLKYFEFAPEIRGAAAVIRFKNCGFSKGIKFKNSLYTSEVTFENCDFCDSVVAIGSRFDKNVRFHDCRFHGDKNFRETTFNKLADFWNSKFYATQIFYKTDFNATAVFSMATFEQNVLFTYSLFTGKSIFAKSEFKKGLDLSQAIISGDLKLFDIHFENDKFQTQYFKRLQKLEYQNAIDNLAIIPTENKVHTFQILRKAYEDVGNYDDATKMRRAEKIALRELTQEKKRDSQHASSTLGDRLILWLNRWSNNFRSDFRNGLTFTGVTAVLFASITLLLTESFYNNICWGCNFDFETFSDGIAFIFRFLNPTHRIDYLDPLNPFLGIAYLFDFLGRIFVGYGIYQTIQAFRKFK